MSLADAHVAGRRDARRGTSASTSGARAAADFRHRGLDLDADSSADAPRRPARKKHPSLRRGRRRLLIQWVVVLALTALVAVLLRSTIIQPYSVNSTSMVPNLRAGTSIVVLKSHRLAGPIVTGDVVVLHRPVRSRCSSNGERSKDLVKRVIGLPGETIWSVKGSIFINGRRLAEQGWYNRPFGEVGPTEIDRTQIPPGSFFVMGDNRVDPCDSRAFGPISASLLVGKALATITRNGHPFVHSL